MLEEKQVRKLYESALDTVRQAMAEVTIDAHIVEAEQQAKILAVVLGERYEAPKRSTA